MELLGCLEGESVFHTEALTLSLKAMVGLHVCPTLVNHKTAWG